MTPCHDRLLGIVALLCFVCSAPAGCIKEYADRIAPLIDPAKLATLGPRGANPRVQKYTYWLEMARRDKVQPGKVIDLALRSVGMTNAQAAELTKAAMLRNLKIADRLGCLDAEGMEEMRHGKAATVRRGPYAGDQLSVDHIVPLVVVPELDNVIANLELMPQRMNSKKNSKVGQRQRDLAEKLYRAGLLSKNNWSTKGNVNPYTGEKGHVTTPPQNGYQGGQLSRNPPSSSPAAGTVPNSNSQSTPSLSSTPNRSAKSQTVLPTPESIARTDQEARTQQARRLRALGLDADPERESFLAMLEKEKRVVLARKLHEMGHDVDWQKHTESEMHDMEIRIKAAARLKQRGVDVDWQKHSFKELFYMEHGQRK